jgi:hypothetical protein
MQRIAKLGSFTLTFTLGPALKIRFYMDPGSFSSTRQGIDTTVGHTSRVSDAYNRGCQAIIIILARPFLRHWKHAFLAQKCVCGPLNFFT